MEMKLNLSKYHIRVLYHSICDLVNNHTVNNCGSEYEQSQLHREDIDDFNDITKLKNKIYNQLKDQGGL